MRWEERRHQGAEAARDLRRRETTAEDVLWRALRGRQVAGFKFRRQHPVGVLMPDFCCTECRLIVEVDGPVHDTLTERDAERTKTLEEAGYRVIRFRNEEILNDLELVLDQIRAELTLITSGSVR